MTHSEQRVVDELAIRQLTAAYSDAVNRGNVEDMAATYAEDGVLSAFGAPDVVGRTEILATFTQMYSDYRWIFQMTHSGTVEIDKEEAWCRWWVSEQSQNNSGKGAEFLGVYQDHVVRTKEGWRFARRLLQGVYLGRRPLEGKIFDTPSIEARPTILGR